MTPDQIAGILDLGLPGLTLGISILLWRHVLTLNAEIKTLNEKLQGYRDEIAIGSRKYVIHEIINTSD